MIEVLDFLSQRRATSLRRGIAADIWMLEKQG